MSRLGDGLTASHLSLIVTQHVKAANIGKSGSCHLFRHAMATLKLEGGADVRMVQAMLGHASLDTTALYTHVAIRTLKEVHERTHPGAILGKPEVESKTTTPDDRVTALGYGDAAPPRSTR